jgi:hypothetical protein
MIRYQMNTWEQPKSLLHLDDETKMVKTMSQLEAKMEEACHSKELSKVTDTRKEVSEWMEEYARAIDQLNGEQRVEVYRKYGTQVDRLKTQLLQLYKIRDR